MTTAIAIGRAEAARARSGGRSLLRAGQLVPISLGVLDSAVIFSYYLHIDVSLFYGASLLLKLLIAAGAGLPSWLLLQRNLHFLAILFFSGVVSAVVGDLTLLAASQLFGFAAHLILTTCTLRPQQYARYFQTAARVILLGAVLFAVEWRRGALTDVWGRFLYFGDSHPNLGGEIAAAGLASACLVSKRLASFSAYAAVLLFQTYLLQSRAALLCGAGLVLVFLYFEVFKKSSGDARPLIVGFACLGIAVMVYAAWSFISNDILMLDNRYRGVGSGFSGRTGEWQEAWDLFLEHPLFGAGYGYFMRPNVDLGHNMVLVALAQLGLLGGVFLALIGKRVIDIWRRQRGVAAVICMFSILAMFDPRLVNLNPYPFLLYVLLFIGPRIGAATGAPRVSTAPGAALGAQ